jgi:hypothetical protein
VRQRPGSPPPRLQRSRPGSHGGVPPSLIAPRASRPHSGHIRA